MDKSIITEVIETGSNAASKELELLSLPKNEKKGREKSIKKQEHPTVVGVFWL